MASVNEDFTPQFVVQHKPVVIIGNGPSAITLSFMLAGNWPYYNRENEPHPIDYLHNRLVSLQSDSLLVADLDFLSQSLTGRSLNPVSVLFDQLQHPNTDFGSNQASVLKWNFHKEKMLDHVVLGCGVPGGVWHQIAKASKRKKLQTVSRARWMQLPNHPIVDNQKPEANQRIKFELVADYYKRYVEHFKLSQYFQNNTKVINVEWNNKLNCFIVDAIQKCQDKCQNAIKSSFCRVLSNVTNRTCIRLRYYTNKVVLATGNHNIPTMLNISGENNSFVIHSLDQLENVVNCSKRRRQCFTDPVLIIGSGLSAADALTLLGAKLKRPVNAIHIFRRSINDRSLIFNQLNNENTFPEYYQVYSSMKQSIKSPYCLNCFTKHGSHYQAYHRCVLTNINGDNHTATLEFIDKKSDERCAKCRQTLHHQTNIKVSLILILIGSKPQLDFLSEEILENLCVDSTIPIDTRHNPINIDHSTYQCIGQPNLYAIGPLVGDNFVRFVQGGSLATASDLLKTKTLKQ